MPARHVSLRSSARRQFVAPVRVANKVVPAVVSLRSAQYLPRPADPALPMTYVRTLLSLSVLVAACSPPTTAEFGPPKTYTKEQRPLQWDAPRNVRLGVMDMGPAMGGEGRTVWVGDAPAGWEKGTPSQFKDAVWKIPGAPDAECYLSAGVGGGVGTNLTRWYTQQFGLAEVPAPEALPQVEIAGRVGRLAELQGSFNGKPGWAALIAFYATGEVVTSLKFTGPASVVTANKDKFVQLAKSLRSATASPDAKAPPIDPGQEMPKGHPPLPDNQQPSAPHNAPTPAPAASPFAATIPAGWTPKAGSPKPLHHTFGKDGDVYVSQLGGALNSSLDIWRGEMGVKVPLTAADVAALPKIAFLGEDAVLLDLKGDLQGMTRSLAGARMLVAARLDGGAITFAKLSGTAAEVEAQIDNFRAFCGSIRRTP